MAGALAALVEGSDRVGQVRRLTVDLLGPVPQRPLRPRVEVVRSGRKVEVVDVALLADDVVVARASGVCIRAGRSGGPAGATSPTGAAPPEEGRPATDRVTASSPFFAGIEFRQVSGTIGEPGPTSVWCRVRHRWFDDEEPSGLVRAAAVADSAYGYGQRVRSADWPTVNVDLTVQLLRPPRGEWILVDATTELGEEGIGLGQARLADREHTIGAVTQSVIVSPARRRRS